jgi:GNAT superfamily N-acetyltransferase
VADPAVSVEPVGLDRLDEIIALVLACDETWRPWAPPGWEPPPAERERESWRRRIDGGGHWVRAALDVDGALLGIAAWRPADREPTEIAHLGMLFVAPEAWGRGIGRILLDAAEEAMVAGGYTRGRLNVGEANPARDFYERRGWAAVAAPAHSPRLDLTVVRYEKEL